MSERWYRGLISFATALSLGACASENALEPDAAAIDDDGGHGDGEPYATADLGPAQRRPVMLGLGFAPRLPAADATAIFDENPPPELGWEPAFLHYLAQRRMKTARLILEKQWIDENGYEAVKRWARGVKQLGMTPFITFDVRERLNNDAPSWMVDARTQEYAAALASLYFVLSLDPATTVTEFGTINEPDLTPASVFVPPNIAALYYYRGAAALKDACQTCTFVAGEFWARGSPAASSGRCRRSGLSARWNYVRLYSAFLSLYATATPALGNPRVWSIHAYHDVSWRDSHYVSEYDCLLRTDLHRSNYEIWVTEAGTILEPPHEAVDTRPEQIEAAHRFLDLADVPSVTRLYWYELRAIGCQNPSHRWDSALLDWRARPRPAFCVLVGWNPTDCTGSIKTLDPATCTVGLFDETPESAPPPLGIAGYDLLAAADQVVPFDYNADGKQDLFLYRPGRGAARVVRSNGDGTFTAVYSVVDDGPAGANGIAGYDLLSPADRVLALDYDGDGRDDLFLYRPGTGAAWVARSNGDGSFTPVYVVADDGPGMPNGIAGYDLRSPADQVLVFDYNGDRRDDLFLYRPGTGAAWVARSNGDGSFTPVYAVADDGPGPPNGVGTHDLRSAGDRVLAFDYNGDGNDDLFLYRPGTGALNVAHSNGDGSFVSVYFTSDDGPGLPNGMWPYDLMSSADRVIAFDYDGDRNDDLFFYRPGTGAACVMRSNGVGFAYVYFVGDDGPAPPNGIGAYDLRSPGDQALAFDYDGDRRQDLLFYRPGAGAVSVIRSNPDGSFGTAYIVGDNGAAQPNGIAGYDLLSPADRILPLDYDGNGRQDLLMYRPGGGAAWVVGSAGTGAFFRAYP